MLFKNSISFCLNSYRCHHNMAPRYLTASSNRRATLVTGRVYARRRRLEARRWSSKFVAPNTWPSVAVRSVQLQLMCGTVCQRQCSLLSHWTFFVAACKLNCSSVLTTDTAPVEQLYWCVTHYHLPAALSTIMLLWHSRSASTFVTVLFLCYVSSC